MAIPSFNQLVSDFNNARNFASSANNFVSQARSQANQFIGPIGEVQSAVNQARQTVTSAREFLNDPLNVGGTARMIQNAAQGVQRGAEPASANYSEAVVNSASSSDGTSSSTAAADRGPGTSENDWRVSLSVPDVIAGSSVFGEFGKTGGNLIFPFNPTILFGSSANYSQVHPTHTNYPYNAYQNSQVDPITISGEFFNENEDDGKYWLAVLHYLRTMTKMFYGNAPHLGNPPLLARLNGYGRFVLNNVPVVITNFTVDLPQDVDYIFVDFNGEGNYVPTQTLVTVTCQTQYSRRAQSTFSLNDFANGNMIGGAGFI